jgi:hypothetical protein
VARLHVLRGEGRAVHPGTETADFTQFVQVSQEGVWIDGGHGDLLQEE